MKMVNIQNYSGIKIHVNGSCDRLQNCNVFLNETEY